MNNTDNNSISLLHAMYNEILSLKAGQEKTKLEMKAQIKELKLKMKTSIEDLNLEITALQKQEPVESPIRNFQELNILHLIMNSIIERFERTGSVEYKSLGGNFRTISKDHHKQFIMDVIDSNNTITLAELQQELMIANMLSQYEYVLICDKSNIQVSGSPHHLCYIERITLKKAVPIEVKRKDEVTLRKRCDFILSLQLKEILYSQNCIFIDEASFNINLIQGRVRAKAEEHALVPTKFKRAKNVTILFALSSEGVELCHTKIVEGETTGPIFKEFVQQLVEKLDAVNAKPYHLVVDNARIHYNPGLREWLKQRNYLQAKHPLDGQEMLVERIKDGSNTITKQDCEGWQI
ncbi:Homeodomain-like DNA binding domain-containing transcription factor [Phycomyces blakesleeanus NRRL 1555(-)]|uniref:Homeodomain-like DNA binding domain-containing transcription factor n=1 Tax=Phycomyces blakesleeanus (strain ATCC 8743b / DSM 1359 / FGSC 10004 / NBRC 33097 / NRRL 1555) TaxID=763407 RepID=A0A162YAD8_PHYB8|nr:Homeodomain-like DNA binding domain-containing transcription factor [Phycomyces blakesleeanus NRRL 1555(-)]OAD79385.1 Homeodomain-like DNA binding domain-containing transcription factor [Phycomyces blakesleeanus NRRL 1555(-)]|eukprot:XP_018297425.1 Homeodomain-like DNA binding domain-containing transcription factor [Phycomyces blakesleeanus NRRL 1555(-)]